MEIGKTNLEAKLVENQKDIQTIQTEISARDTDIITLESKIKAADIKSIRSKDINKNELLDHYRKMTICQLCKKNPKDVVIDGCFHTFCSECLNKRVARKDRKCPTCKEKFKSIDIKAFYWK